MRDVEPQRTPVSAGKLRLAMDPILERNVTRADAESAPEQRPESPTHADNPAAVALEVETTRARSSRVVQANDDGATCQPLSPGVTAVAIS
jgi:hypothetical protein